MLLENEFTFVDTGIIWVNDKYSDVKPISFGVPQGFTLGPLLFLIYLNDVFQDIDYETILYADDATVVIHAKTLFDLFRAANKSLTIIHNNLLVNKLTLNISKTKFVILTPPPHRLARNPDHVISVYSIPISEVYTAFVSLVSSFPTTSLGNPISNPSVVNFVHAWQ